ncbi:NCS2 family permease [Pseudokineococcus lusitanus]|uniref:AGZA family xanthine/uracil permease-like MFS transporter n=1 Tax=Pseudokineococcus lusitanus TaxID=763993 RepID=A0A3N1HT60_9ACTN|nr:NCS2 family permease [Pseudokineococcus lusitanus]ROP45667.1 AGZA family xanthine/uracil permease-like MFS transporter [Pseudokineococcus lusitanus]
MSSTRKPADDVRRDGEAPVGALDRYFSITARGSTTAREVRGGLVTFVAMAYIVVLNPLIIGTVPDSTGAYLGGGDAPNLPAVAAVTALVAGVLTITMGVVGRFPLGLAAGLGLNAFVAYGIVGLPGMTWPAAMGLVVLEGLVILVLVLTGFRKAVLRAVPGPLKTAISVGIGLFLTLVGLVNAGIVRTPAGAAVPLELGIGGSLRGWPTVVFVVGLVVTVVLMARAVRGALLVGILVATALAVVVQALFDVGPRVDGDVLRPTGFGLSVPQVPEQWLALPDLSLLGQFSLVGGVAAAGAVTAVLVVFSLVVADFFDTMGTMVAVGHEADLLDDEGNPVGSQRILLVDSLAAVAGGAASASSATSFVESAAGVGDGARTGLASVVTGAAFLVAVVAAPLVTLVPYEAASPALVVVGFLMMRQVKGIDWDDIGVGLPAFLAVVLMPFAYSITVGIGAGFLAYVLLAAVRGRVRDVHPLMWVVAAVFAVYFTIGPIQDLLA